MPTPLPQDSHFLRALSPDVQERLYPHLELVSLEKCDVVYEANRRIRYVYFPTSAIISVQFELLSGDSTAIMVVGNEGLLGLNVFLAKATTPTRSLVQSAGWAYRIARTKVKEEFNRHEELLVLMLRYTQALITQISQTAVCNRRHTIDEQLCRWLLLSLDRLPDNSITMTQEFIANMIGVRREGVTFAARRLRDLGIITYRRGLINVLDRHSLEKHSCECYDVVKRETDMLLHYMPNRQLMSTPASIPKETVVDFSAKQ